ncbi:hypothetical protein ACCO45_009201 [Purpureocillium lilacinum]|uniref:Uncharacterized protein n=1 Tax=Purpureocillium lilacinum TaxID=33203 RepID=A0ACC4DIZ9_PURLI
MGLGTAVDSGQPFLRALLMSAQDGTGWSAGPNEQEAGLASQRRRQDPSTAQSERGGQGCCGGRCEFRAETNGWARAEAEVLSRDEADSHNTSPLDRAGWGRIGTGQGSCEPVGVSVVQVVDDGEEPGCPGGVGRHLAVPVQSVMSQNATGRSCGQAMMTLTMGIGGSGAVPSRKRKARADG